MSEGDTVQAKADNISLVVFSFGIMSAIVEVLHLIKQECSGGEGKIIVLFVTIALIASAASVALRPPYTTICSRISFLFSVLACALLLSPFVPNKLFWVPYLACVFPLLHLLQLFPDPLQRSLQQLWRAPWNAIGDAARGTHHAIVRCLQVHGLLPSNGINSAILTSSSSAAPAVRIVEEVDASRDAAHGAHLAIVRSLEAPLPSSIAAASNGNLGGSTSSSSAAQPELTLEIDEGDGNDRGTVHRPIRS